MAWCGVNTSKTNMYTSDAQAPTGGAAFKKITGDFNGDGIMDTAYVSQTGAGRTGALGNAGRGAAAVSYRTVTGDFNGDGVQDKMILSQRGGAYAAGGGYTSAAAGGYTTSAAQGSRSQMAATTSRTSQGFAANAAAGGATHTKITADFNGDGVADTLYLSNARQTGGITTSTTQPVTQPIVVGGTRPGCQAIATTGKQIYVDVPVTERIRVDNVRRKQVTKLIPECKTIMTKEMRTRQENYYEPELRTKIERVPKNIMVTEMKVIKRPKQICAKKMVTGMRTEHVPITQSRTRMVDKVVMYTENQDRWMTRSVPTTRPCTVQVPKYRAVVTGAQPC